MFFSLLLYNFHFLLTICTFIMTQKSQNSVRSHFLFPLLWVNKLEKFFEGLKRRKCFPWKVKYLGFYLFWVFSLMMLAEIVFDVFYEISTYLLGNWILVSQGIQVRCI
uniref:Uncharacterized protein n=1 Tax=Cacopsylla melanoneura TaxID=428564 RepID=A0A8D8TKC7_9HEMI